MARSSGEGDRDDVRLCDNCRPGGDFCVLLWMEIGDEAVCNGRRWTLTEDGWDLLDPPPPSPRRQLIAERTFVDSAAEVFGRSKAEIRTSLRERGVTIQGDLTLVPPGGVRNATTPATPEGESPGALITRVEPLRSSRTPAVAPIVSRDLRAHYNAPSQPPSSDSGTVSEGSESLPTAKKGLDA